MKIEEFLFLVIMTMVSALMFYIGFTIYNSKEAAGLWMGKNPPEEDEYSNMTQFNHVNGLLWIVYSILIFVGAIVCVILKNIYGVFLLGLIIVLGISLITFGHYLIVNKSLGNEERL